jgi:hypothetical protein
MPHNSRQKIRAEAKIMRETGETVVLFMSTETPDTDETPLSISSADEPQNLGLMTQQAIYARVSWATADTLTYGPGGRNKGRKASIDCSIEWLPQLQQTFVVQVEDGTLMRKIAEKISDDRVTYTIVCEGYLNVSN